MRNLVYALCIRPHKFVFIFPLYFYLGRGRCDVFVRVWAGLGSVFSRLGLRQMISFGFGCPHHVLDVLRVVFLNLLRFE